MPDIVTNLHKRNKACSSDIFLGGERCLCTAWLTSDALQLFIGLEKCVQCHFSTAVAIFVQLQGSLALPFSDERKNSLNELIKKIGKHLMVRYSTSNAPQHTIVCDVAYTIRDTEFDSMVMRWLKNLKIQLGKSVSFDSQDPLTHHYVGSF